MLVFWSQIAKFMGPTWVLSAPDGTHIGPMNLAITGVSKHEAWLKAVQLAPWATGFAAIYFHEHMSRIEQQTCLMIIQGKHVIYICQHPLWMMTWANVGPASRPLYRRWSNVGPTYITDTEMSWFWLNFHLWLHWKLSKLQFAVQPVMKISPKWNFHFSDCCLNCIQIRISYIYRGISKCDSIPFRSPYKYILKIIQ